MLSLKEKHFVSVSVMVQIAVLPSRGSVFLHRLRSVKPHHGDGVVVVSGNLLINCTTRTTIFIVWSKLKLIENFNVEPQEFRSKRSCVAGIHQCSEAFYDFSTKVVDKHTCMH